MGWRARGLRTRGDGKREDEGEDEGESENESTSDG